MGYGDFAAASRSQDGDGPKPKGGAGPVKSCRSNLTLHREVLTVLPGEGPIHLERRLRQKLPGLTVSWTKIVEQNKERFGGVKVEDIADFDYRNNGDLRPGDVITYDYYLAEPVLDEEFAPPQEDDLLPIVDPVTGTPLKLAVQGSLKASTSVEVVFGLDAELLEAKVGIGMEMFTEGKFVLDRKGMDGELEGGFKFFLSGEAGIDLGPFEWSAAAKASYAPLEDKFEFSMDRTVTREWTSETLNQSLSDALPKTIGGAPVEVSASAALSWDYFHFEYDAKANVTRIGMTVTARAAFDGTVTLGNPFIHLHLRTAGEGNISFVAELPGNQSHLKPRSGGEVQTNRAVPTMLITPLSN